MSDRHPDSVRLITSESDDERKPSLSPYSPNPASTMVVAQSPPIFGPNRPCSSHIIDLLEDYHRENGPKTPQFAYKGRAICQSKVFNRQGKEVDLSLFSIEEPCPYKILVLHRPGERDSLVTCHLPYASKHGTYLVAWQGVEKGYEAECCAVRIFNRNLNAIRFSDEVWKALDDTGKKSKDAPVQSTAPSTRSKRGVETPRSTKGTGANRSANTSTGGNTGTTNKKSTSNANGSANAKADAEPNADANSESEYETDTGSDESSGEESSDEESESLPPAKKVKSAPESPVTQTPDTAVVFKLVSYKSGAIRCFPLEECKTAKDLFQKARDFFRLFDRNVDAKILCCQISSRPEQHYLFEGSEGEFSLLVEQVKGSQAGDGRCTIEVGHVLAC